MNCGDLHCSQCDLDWPVAQIGKFLWVIGSFMVASDEPICPMCGMGPIVEPVFEGKIFDFAGSIQW